MRVVQRNFIIMLHNLIILTIIWLVFQWPLSISVLLSLLGVAILYLFLTGCSIVIALVCVRYRDVPPIVTATTQFLFFASPILWYPEQLKFGTAILSFNPFAYLISVVRDPVLGRAVAPEAWAISVLITMLVIGLASLTYVRYRDRVAYWI